MLTVALVVMVIFLFLRTLSATIIPSVAVPLSLVGTFGVMYLLGYSLNNLTLMALTISTGFVVDDAIVMIENIARFIERRRRAAQAALKGSEQIGFTIVSLTVSLIAVLIPLLFMGDIVGRLFREFAVTLAVTILVSAVVSLTLTPMMARQAPEAHAAGAAGALLSRVGAGVRARDRGVRPDARRRARPPDVDAAGLRRHAGADHPALRHRAEGLLPDSGHRRDPGRLSRRSDGVVPADDGAAAAGGPHHPEGPGGREPLVLHRDRSDQHDAEQRTRPDQPEAAQRRAGRTRAT